MAASSNIACRHCGASLRADESLCPRCLFDTVATDTTGLPEERIFQEALALDPDARTAFIREASQGDPQLLAAVELLFQGYAEAGGDTSQPTQGGAPNARAQWALGSGEEPGTVIHHFRLVRLLGEGGMGSVWRAEQTAPVLRTVALKVIKLGMDTREVVKRFERERQTLALLNHPNIAQVFEAGATALGRPYFAMELVEGQPITAYCESARLDLEARLKLFQEVCAAVEHAHQKGVIHRDLKPSNLMVTNGLVKVIDFGVAKATQSTPGAFATQHSRIVGTPAYMSPEQAETGGGDVDTRTDVYALGVVLYEMLTGTLPIESHKLESTSVAEMQRIIREEKPPTPSTRLTMLVSRGKAPAQALEKSRKLQGDLDRIVMKAIRKDRNERYASAAAFAEDLRRYLAGEPVSAVPPTVAYHLGKFVRRHRVAVSAAVAVFLALAAGTVVSTMMAVQARRAAANERIARQETVKTLTRMHTQLALNDGREGRPAQAALWAAQAAQVSVDDPLEHEASIKRVALWTAEVPMPLRAFQSDFDEVKKLIFHPTERYLLAEHREGDRQLWDLERETKLFIGGADRFAAAAWNSDGTLLALARPGTNEIALLQFPGGTVTQLPVCDPANTNAISSLAFNGPGTMLAAGAGNSVAIFRRAQDGTFTFLLSIPQTNFVRRIVFSPTNPNCFATAMSNALAGLFSIEPEKPAYAAHFTAAHHQSTPRRIDSAEPPYFDRTGETVRLSYREGRNTSEGTFITPGSAFGIATYHVASGRALVEHQPLMGFALAHSPDGRLVICRHDGARPVEVASVADASTGKGIATVTFNRIVTVADFSADSQRAIVGSEDGQVMVLAAPDWKPEFQLALHPTRVMGVAFSPSGRFAATAQLGSIIRIWRMQYPHRSTVALGHDSRVTLSQDGQFFALAGRSAADATLPFSRVYRTSDGQPVGPPMRVRNFGHEPVSAPPLHSTGGAGSAEMPRLSADSESVVLDATFSPDGESLAIAVRPPGLSHGLFVTNQGCITFWNWRTGEQSGEAILLQSEPRSLAWRPDGNQVGVCCASGEFLSVNPRTRQLTQIYHQNFNWPARFLVNNGEVAYNQSGTLLVGWGIQRECQVWTLSEKESHHRSVATETQCADAAVSPDGVLALAQTGTRSSRNPQVFLQEAATGLPIGESLDHPEWLNSVAFNGQGNLLLTTTRDGIARIWDWRARRLLCPPIQHQGSVFTGRFVNGAPYVVTGADRGRFTIADARTGLEIASFRVATPASQILEILVARDGRTALFGGKELGGVGIVRLDLLHGRGQLDSKGLMKLAILNAAAKVDREGALVPISAEQWLVLWKEFRREFSNYHEF